MFFPSYKDGKLYEIVEKTKRILLGKGTIADSMSNMASLMLPLPKIMMERKKLASRYRIQSISYMDSEYHSIPVVLKMGRIARNV